MLSKTAMLLVPAASLVGAAALAPTTSLAQSGENGFIAVNAWTASVGETLPPPLAPGAWLKSAGTTSSPHQKKLNGAQ